MDRLRRNRANEGRGGTVSSKLTEDEKAAKLAEMQAASQALRDHRRDRTGYTEA